MSTKEEGYVVCYEEYEIVCYKELSQSLKVQYFMAVKENVARRCELFPFLSHCLCGSVIVPAQS